MTLQKAPYPLIGGVHLPDHKHESTQKPIQTLSLAPRLIIPLLQHIGEEAKPIVAMGDHVLKGQKIGEVRAFVSTPVHASTSGTIVDIGLYPVDHPSQLHGLCVVIKPDGLDEWAAHTGLDDYLNAPISTLLAIIREAGIAGMGGAGFPTGSKLSLKEHTPVDIVVLNAMECEPYITADDMLMRERANEVIEGAKIVQYMLQAQQIIIGIEDNKAQAINALQQIIKDDSQIIISVTPTRYPSGAARQTVYILTGREVPASGRTTDVGVFCLNVATAAAVYRAVVLGEPLLSRITTVTGLGVAQAANFEVLIGTPIRHLLSQAQAKFEQISRLIIGGPMMGYTLPHADIAVIKTTNCVIAATNKDFAPPPPEMPCIRCGDCAVVCPVVLLPQQLLWFAKSKEFDKAKQHNLDDCIECGACAYVCPSNIPLVQYYRYAKGELATQQQEAEKAEIARVRFESRKERLAQEEADKEAKRQARQIAAAKAKEDAAKQLELAPQQNSVAPAIDSKTLMIAAATARSNLKKAQKRLLAAQTAQEDTTAIEQEIEQLQAEVTKLQTGLS
ncbi:MAG: electron transport complex subunit RsxC [Moraxellaceae bacterium]|nr:electron transport complex subunit RsxC [Moraxellaceae bacterium]